MKGGYAFKHTDGTFVLYSQKIDTSNSITDVTVVKCSAHQDKDNNTLCDYCNTDITSAAAKVTTAKGAIYYFMAEQASGVQTVDAAVASATDTVTLLANFAARIVPDRHETARCGGIPHNRHCDEKQAGIVVGGKTVFGVYG